MRFTKITAVLLSAATLSIAPLKEYSFDTQNTSAFTTEAMNAGKAIAETNGIVLDSDFDAAELAVLNQTNDGILPEMKFEDCKLTHFDGVISDKIVRSERDAKAVLASIANLLGIQDIDAELSFDKAIETEYSICYSFKQIYQGIEVDEKGVSIFVDKCTGKADYLNSTFIAGLSLDTVPAFSAGVVRSIVRKNYNTGLKQEAQLVIFETAAKEAKLAFKAQTLSEEYSNIYVDAQNGTILSTVFGNSDVTSGYTSMGYTYSKSKANTITGKTCFGIRAESFKNNNTMLCRLHDVERNIWIMNSSYLSDRSYDMNRLNYLSNDDLNRHVFITSKNAQNKWNDFDEISVGIMYNMERAYDYYRDLGIKGTELQISKNGKLGANNPTNIIVSGDYPECNNSCAYTVGNRIQFGNGEYDYVTQSYIRYPQARDTGLVVHEYTHLLTQNLLRWGGIQTGEKGCLNEAYSDIMGECGEYYITGRNNWKIGTDTFCNDYTCIRDLTRSTAYRDGFGYQHYYDTQDYVVGEKNRIDISNIECHAGSTIISRVAYTMYQNGFSVSDIRDIWLNSLLYLVGTNLTFSDCRAAVVRATKDQYNVKSYSYRNTRIGMVQDAFNTVHIN